MKFEQSEFGVDALIGRECYHVGLEVGHRDRIAFGIGEGDKVNDLVYVAVFVLCESLSLYFFCASRNGICLYPWSEVCLAVGAQIAFERVLLVGRAFLAASGFLSFSHVIYNFTVVSF